MKGNFEILRLVEISRLYYEEGLTQAEIAEKSQNISTCCQQASCRGQDPRHREN